MERCTDSYELLALNPSKTTTDESEAERFAKRRLSRRKRRSRTPAVNQSLTTSSTNSYDFVSKCCWHLLCLFFIGNLLWIFGLTWVATSLRTDMQVLRNITEKVSAGSDVIPESIQKCHSLTRQLEKNQTKINNQLQRVAQRLSNFSSMIMSIQINLTKVEKKLDESPSPQLVPDMLERVGVTIAAFKAEILEMQSKASSIVNQQSEIKQTIDVLTGNLTTFNDELAKLKKHSSEVLPSDQSGKDDLVNLIVGTIKPKIQQVNTSILSKVKWLSDDLQKAQKTINNLADESEYLKSLINTTRHDLKLHSHDISTLQSDIKAHTKEWDELIEETRTLESNVTKLVTSCSQCKYNHNEDSVTSTTTVPSASEMSSLSRKNSDRPV